MLVEAGREILQDDYHGQALKDFVSNGGYVTLTQWQSEEERFQGEWLKYIDKLPEYKVYQNIDGLIIMLSHAGFTPIVGENNTIHFNNNLLWSRSHFNDAWPVGCEDIVVIHGHTPNCYIDEEINETRDAEIELGAYWYCNNHKVCLDTGAVWTDTAVLLDLDDFTEYIIQAEGNDGK